MGERAFLRARVHLSCKVKLLSSAVKPGKLWIGSMVLLPKRFMVVVFKDGFLKNVLSKYASPSHAF